MPKNWPMKSAQKPQNEKLRIQDLQSLNILDTLPEQDFDQITFLASQICGTPIALISLVDENRQWFKSKVGIAAVETPREMAFCAHAILEEGVFEIPDATKDERFNDNPLVTSDPNVHFYAGAPLKSPHGMNIGTLCVIDDKPRLLNPKQTEALKALSQQVTRLLELRLQVDVLRQAHEKLQFKNTAIETIFEGIVLQNRTGAIIDFNSSAPTVLNLTSDELQGKTSIDPSWRAIKEDGSDFPGQEHPAMVCLQTGKAQKNVVMGIQNSQDKVRWIKINSAPIFEGTEKLPKYAVTSFADITAEVTAKKILEQKRADLRFILDSVPSLIGLWSADETNLNSNSAYSEYFKKSPEKILGIKLKELLGEGLYKENLPYIQRVLAGETVTFERTLPHRDGTLRHTMASYIPNFEGKQVSSFLVVIADITALKTMEVNQRMLEAKIAESAKLAALGEMAAGVAHEINNPLTIIKGKAAMLIRQAGDRTFDWNSNIRHLQSIENTTDRIAKIIKALRIYSRDATNDPPEVANVSEIIGDTLELCYERFRSANVEIRRQCESTLQVSCRPAQISQVLMNLLNNSFDAITNNESKWIEIKGFKADGNIYLQISDSGSGIPKTVVEKMMNPFFTTKGVGKGTGLGLSISTGILQSHGGSLKYCAEFANTTFMMILPEFNQKTNRNVA